MPAAPSELEGVPQGKAQVRLQRGRFVVIVATLNLTQGTGKILHVKHVPQAMVPTISPTTIASVRLLDRSGRVLGDYPQWVRHATDIPREEDQTALINATIPETRNLGSVEVVLAERVVDRLEVPRTPPTVGPVRIRVADSEIEGHRFRSAASCGYVGDHRDRATGVDAGDRTDGTDLYRVMLQETQRAAPRRLKI